ncbi:beta strand repeat-containing protein [Pedobacter ureilyticus]|uniref:Beta strand repeat-containing protein n=1 Tax=Pedobacter ureilyticus TaxID=1393051 RepID=A0ABW9J544_9SPHI|nr:hypothetical protein [Pedobacter helvus]
MKRIIRTTALCALLVAAAELAQAQVKIGDNPTVINKASILELESSTKGLLFPRVSLINTTTWSLASGSTPVAGMMVYNIKTVASGFSGTSAYPAIAGDGTGIYYWDGNGWVAAKGLNGADGKSVTGAAGAPGATTPGNEGDTYINTTTGDTYIKQGNTWVLNGNIKGAKGDPGVVGVQGMPGTNGTPGTPGSGTPGAPGAGVTIVTNDSGTWVYNPTTNTWTNINGPKGDKGDPGVVGVQGMPGSGTPGTPGTPGGPGAGVTIVTNDSGTWVYNPTTNTWTNINGPKGDKGDPGVVGVQGMPGSGTPGTPGTPGGPGAGVTIVTNDSGTWVYNPSTNTWTNINGPKGDKGDPGVVGVQGMPGSGTPGTPGTPGGPGAGVTIVTNDSGTWVYNPTTNTWTNINGPKGDKGDPGVVGVQGMPGSGTPGTPGTPGGPGAGVTIVTNDSGTWVYNPTTNTWTNINGPKGDKGDPGVVGVQGMPGSGTPGTPGTPGGPGAGITIVTNDSGTWVYNPSTNTWTNINGPKGDKGDAGTFTATVDNGLNFSTPTNIQLGGTLIKPTTITTDATQTLAIAGLQSGVATGATPDKIVVADPTTGVLKQVDRSTFDADLRLVGTRNHITKDAGVGSNGTNGGFADNIFIGQNVGSASTNASGQSNGNVGIGTNALKDNIGINNVAIGLGAAVLNKSGSLNTAVGAYALQNNTDGGSNAGFGHWSLSNTTTGNENTAVGTRSGNNITTGSWNITLGSQAWVPSATASNQLSIGNLIYGTGLDGRFPNISTGNIGIGVKAPSEKLDINGRLRVRTFDPGLTTDNFVVADANGVLKTVPSTSINATDWHITGNVGTTAANFLGTTDDVPLNFKIDNTVAGNVSKTGTSFGYKANTGTGDHNTAFGLEALSLVTTGLNNTAMGAQALRVNTGSANTAFGNEALVSNTTGGANVAVGNYAMRMSTTGTGNTALGNSAMSQNTQGALNVAIGGNALLRNTTGFDNVALGTGSLQTNTTGYRNVAIGGSADVSADNLTNAIAIGFQSRVGASNSLALGGTDFYQVNVGINTPTPSNKLHIVGNGTADPVRIEGLQAGAATDNMVVADASGVLKTLAIPSSVNIYNANGSLTSNRVVTLAGKNLTFTSPERDIVFDSNGRIANIAKTGYEADIFLSSGSGATYNRFDLQSFSNGQTNLTASGAGAQQLLLGTHATQVAAPLLFSTSSGGGALGTEKMRITGTGNVGIAANVPTEKLDIGQGNVRIRDINSNTGAASDKVVVADATGVLKTVSAVAPQFFYTPSLVLPTSNSNLPSYVTYAGGTFTVNLHGVYASQFGMAGNVSGAARTAIKSPTATTLPVLGAAALEYFVTYFDNTVFDPASITLSDAGVLTYQVLSTGTVSEKTYMNIVFKVK